MSVAVDGTRLPEFLIPHELLSFQPTERELFMPVKSGTGLRLIQNNVLLREKEREQIADFRKCQAKKKIALADSVVPHIYRYIQMAQGNISKAVQLAVEGQEWRRKTFGPGPMQESELYEDLKMGFAYFPGRDSAFRPWLILRLKVIAEAKHWSSQRILNLCVYSWEFACRYLFIPGKVETLNVVVDCEGVGLTTLPKDKLITVIGFAGSPAYPGRLNQLFIVNPPPFFSSMIGFIKAFMAEADRKKLQVCKGKEMIAGTTALHQMEKKYGGTREPVTTFYPYPLLPGPFTADYDGGPDRANAVPYCHRALCGQSTVGTLCETTEVCSIPWSPLAQDIFDECGIPWKSDYIYVPFSPTVARTTFTAIVGSDEFATIAGVTDSKIDDTSEMPSLATGMPGLPCRRSIRFSHVSKRLGSYFRPEGDCVNDQDITLLLNDINDKIITRVGSGSNLVASHNANDTALTRTYSADIGRASDHPSVGSKGDKFNVGVPLEKKVLRIDTKAIDDEYAIALEVDYIKETDGFVSEISPEQSARALMRIKKKTCGCLTGRAYNVY